MRRRGLQKRAFAGPYAYDSAEPLTLRDNGLANSDYPIKIRDISFDGGAERVPAFLLMPPGKGPYPAVIYLHGQGGDRLEMLYTASWLAGRRAIAMTVESPYSPTRSVELGPGVEGLRKERNRTARDADPGGQPAEVGLLVPSRPLARGPEGAARPARLVRRGAGDRRPTG